MAGVDGGDQRPSRDGLGEARDARAVGLHPVHGHPLGEHPHIDVEDRQSAAEKVRRLAYFLLEYAEVAFDIGVGRALACVGAGRIVDIALREELPQLAFVDVDMEEG